MPPVDCVSPASARQHGRIGSQWANGAAGPSVHGRHVGIGTSVPGELLDLTTTSGSVAIALNQSGVAGWAY